MNQNQVAGIPGSEPAQSEQLSRFDIEMSGLRLLLPEAVSCEYFAQAVVYPLPRAPRRLLGMMHLRGHPVPVFDTHRQTSELLPIIQHCQLVVLRTSHDAVGLICDRPPGLVSLLGETNVSRPQNVPFESALEMAFRVTDEETSQSGGDLGLVWSFDPSRLIECCLAEPAEAAL